MYGGEIPDHLDLAEIENHEILKLIADDLFIIAYITNKWCDEYKVISSESEDGLLDQGNPEPKPPKK